MNVNDFMAKHDITDADLERMPTPFENGYFELEPDRKVFSGSHLEAVCTRRVTVIHDEKDTQRAELKKIRGQDTAIVSRPLCLCCQIRYSSYLLPFPQLQSSQSVCRLSITDFPPRETGLIWSTWSFTPSSRPRPHLTHLKPSRRSTS